MVRRAVLMQGVLTQSRALRGEDGELSGLGRRLLCGTANPLAPVASPHLRAQTFNGDSARLPGFSIQAASNIMVLRARFYNDTLEVAFLISRLPGTAAKGVIPYIERENPNLAHSMDYVDALKRGSAGMGKKPAGAPQRGTEGWESLHWL